MRIKLDIPLKNLVGEELKFGDEILTLGKALANILLASEEGGKMKLFVLAKKSYEQKAIEIDESDFALIKRIVSGPSRAYTTALVQGQVELLLSEIKE